MEIRARMNDGWRHTSPAMSTRPRSSVPRASSLSRVRRARWSSSSSRRANVANVARGRRVIFNDNAGDSSVSVDGTTRRASLLALTLAMTTTASVDVARASPFDDLASAKRRTNAKFLAGPVATARARLAALRRDLVVNGGLDVDDAREALTKATLDCATPRDSLKAYSNARDVCTLSILTRSVTKGPAARNADDSQESMAVYDALERTKDSFGVVEAAVERAFESGAEEKEKLDAAFVDADAALYDFARALAACFRFDDRSLDALLEDVPGAFVEPER